MNIIDAVILILLGLGFLIGFKRGFTKELVCFIGFFLVILLSFIFKNTISSFLYNNLPFFSFGLFKGMIILNVLLYEIIAFVIIGSILAIILKILIAITGLFEKLLKATIILSIPSKILGGVVGIIESYFIIFVVLYIASLPFFNFTMFEHSTFKNVILSKTPYISAYTGPTNEVINEIITLKDEYATDNSEEFNYKAMDLMLKYDIITTESASDLVAKGKLNITNINELIEKYKEFK